MRHRKRGRKLNRSHSHRKAMLSNMVNSLFEHGRITTTPAKAKEARPLAEKLITMAKGGSLAERRRAISILKSKQVVKSLFEEIAPRYAKRPGGYSRILHLDQRRLGDGGAQCIFELVEEEVKSKGKKKRARATVKKSESEAAAPAEKGETQPEESKAEEA